MKAFLAGCLAAIVLAVIWRVALDSMQEPVDQAYRSPYARVGD